MFKRLPLLGGEDNGVEFGIEQTFAGEKCQQGIDGRVDQFALILDAEVALCSLEDRQAKIVNSSNGTDGRLL